MRSVSSFHSSMRLSADSRQTALNSAMPYASMSDFDVNPSCYSTAISTGRPWQS